MKFEINTSDLPRYIAVEGPIGVGKTSFTKRLAEVFNYETVLEAPEVNPFLERFYQNRRQAALQTQLFFLFERMRQINEMRQGDMFEPVRVADFLLEKDRLFAEINLDADEMKLYDNIYAHLTIDAPQPDLVVYLQAPVPVLMDRIQQRGISYEQGIQKPYLTELTEAYTTYFHFYDRSPLLIVNTTEIDLVNNQNDFEDLVRFLLTIKRGRHYYNPKPSII
ncbi:MAG: deoxynucleoside kinase [Pseudomonadales bacterium]